jgi:limonene-1,2-epoxide hydrolase
VADTIIIELTGNFALDAADKIQALDDSDLVEVAIGTGLGAERVVKFIATLSKPAIEALKKLVRAATKGNRVIDFKVTRSGVEIGSFPVDSKDDVQALVEAVLDKIRER